MHTVLLLGCGKIGRMIAELLVSCGEYRVRVADVDAQSLLRLRDQIDVETALADNADNRILKELLKTAAITRKRNRVVITATASRSLFSGPTESGNPPPDASTAPGAAPSK